MKNKSKFGTWTNISYLKINLYDSNLRNLFVSDINDYTNLLTGLKRAQSRKQLQHNPKQLGYQVVKEKLRQKQPKSYIRLSVLLS